MRGSTLIPWLFFGPLFAALAAKVVYDFTGAGWVAIVALACLTLAVCVAAAAFVANWQWLSRRGAGRNADD